MQPDPGLSTDLRELSYGEHLLVWAFRAFAQDRFDCPMVVREFREACGPLAPKARAAILIFAQQLQQQGRRPVVLGRAGCLTLTRDEQLLLAVFAAAQRTDEARCQAHLTWLLAGSVEAPFYSAAVVAAQALAHGGHGLGTQDPDRILPDVPAPRARAAAVGAAP